jgi:putative membrane protein
MNNDCRDTIGIEISAKEPKTFVMKKKVLFVMPLVCAALFSFAQGTDTTRRPTTDTTTTGTTTTTGGGGGMATAEDSLMMDTRIQAGSLHKKDVKFLVEAASSSRMEIELGQMAQQKGASQQVRDFGAMMVRDHTLATQELKSIVSSKGASLPDTLMPKHRALMDRLNGLQGAEFDKAYMAVMRDAHENDIDEFEDETKDARDPDVKAFATKQLPVLQGHHQHAKDAKAPMKQNMKQDKKNNKSGSGSGGTGSGTGTSGSGTSGGGSHH